MVKAGGNEQFLRSSEGGEEQAAGNRFEHTSTRTLVGGSVSLPVGRGTDLGTTSDMVAGIARANLAALAGHGITEVTDLETATATYNASIGKREQGGALRSGTRTSLTGIFERADDVLCNQLDEHVKSVMNDQPELYNEYQAARVIKDLGIRHEEETPVTPTTPTTPTP
jgi:hypothetical protein